MKLSWFVSVNLILLVGIVHVYNWAKLTYSDRDILQAQVRTLTKSLKRQELDNIALLDRFEGFRQEVAALMPDALRLKGETPEGFSLRSLASVTQSSRGVKKESLKEALAISTLKSAKEAFAAKDYKQSNSLLKKFIDQDGYSARTPEAYLLLSEGLYQETQLEESSEVIRKMVDLFPGHEVTGFALIRLGSILEQRGRASDAIDLYKTILKTFPQREVASQAKESLRGVGL